MKTKRAKRPSYPREYYGVRRRGMLGLALFILIFSLIGFSHANALVSKLGGPLQFMGIAAVLVILLGLARGLIVPTDARIGFCYDPYISQVEMLCNGYALARNWGYLNELAEKNRIKPLSALGISKEDFEEPGAWREVTEGLDIVEALAKVVSVDLASVDDPLEVLGDLERMKAWLMQAKVQGAKFSLVIKFK